MQRPRAFLTAVSAFSALGLCACAVGPDFHRPILSGAAGYTPANLAPETTSADVHGGAAQQFVGGQDIPSDWWTQFQSPTLDRLVKEALRANPDLSAAQAALRQAREIAYAERAALFPTIVGAGSATRERTSNASFGVNLPPQTLSVTSASLNVSYAPDVWGGVRRQVEAGAAEAEFQRFQVEATYLTLTTNVVNSAIALASLHDQIAATSDIIRIRGEQVEVSRRRLEIGAISRADVLAQEAALAETRASLPLLQKQHAQARDQLMAYLGRFPSQDGEERFELTSLTLPEMLPISLPSKLVEQRPDVRAAEAQLHEASANLGVAIANQLPQFSITGQLGANSNDFLQLLSSGTGVWSIAGSVSQVIFDAGAARHRRRGADAAYDEAAARYRRTVLAAFQDVADALQALQSDADALGAASASERVALASLDLVRKQYRLGAVDQLTLLNAETTYENALVARIRAQAARYSDTAALFQALGGGWWNRADVTDGSLSRSARLAALATPAHAR